MAAHHSPNGMIGESESGRHHDLSVEIEIGGMHRFISYYKKVLTVAMRGTFSFSNSYFWAIGALIVWGGLRLKGYEMEIPSNIPGGVMAAAVFFMATWVPMLAIRIFLFSHFEIFTRANEQLRDLKRQLKQSNARIAELLSPPDVTIAMDKDPLVFERENVPEAKGRPAGILIAFRDVRIINRSTSNLSIEVRLRIWLRPGFFYSLDQTSVNSWGALSKKEAAADVIGTLFPNVIDVASHTVENGSLAYFIPADDESVKRSVFLSLAARYPDRNPVDVIADLPKELDLIEHLSSRRAEIDATKAFSCNL